MILISMVFIVTEMLILGVYFWGVRKLDLSHYTFTNENDLTKSQLKHLAEKESEFFNIPLEMRRRRKGYSSMKKSYLWQFERDKNQEGMIYEKKAEEKNDLREF